MPDARSHLRQAQHNRALINTLDPANTPFLDWVVTVAFYMALHRIEAWFAGQGLHFESHTQRDDWLTKVKELRRGVWPRYKELEFQSHQARYQCVSNSRYGRGGIGHLDFGLNSPIMWVHRSRYPQSQCLRQEWNR